MRSLIGAATAVALFWTQACSKSPPGSLTPEGARVRIAEPEAVFGCEYIADFMGGAGPHNFAPWLEAVQVRNLAGEHGATDVVYDERARRGVVGRAYRCP